MSEMTDAKRRLVERLKRVDAATAGELAHEFELTDTAVRQHLEQLQELGFVRRIEGSAQGRGRPAARWQLTSAASPMFPDRHGDLAIDLLDTIRTELGEDALGRVLERRTRRQAEQLRTAVGSGSVAVRIRRLAEQRTAEGYVAEVIAVDGEFLLVEHHCPICSAATACSALCNSELDAFQQALGDGVMVRREQHVLSGDQRCAYRITAA